jgi:hypothetical protein
MAHKRLATRESEDEVQHNSRVLQLVCVNVSAAAKQNAADAAEPTGQCDTYLSQVRFRILSGSLHISSPLVAYMYGEHRRQRHGIKLGCTTATVFGERGTSPSNLSLGGDQSSTSPTSRVALAFFSILLTLKFTAAFVCTAIFFYTFNFYGPI